MKIAIDPVLIGLRLVETKIPPYSLPLVLIPPLASGGEVVNSILLSHLTAVGPRGERKRKESRTCTIWLFVFRKSSDYLLIYSPRKKAKVVLSSNGKRENFLSCLKRNQKDIFDY